MDTTTVLLYLVSGLSCSVAGLGVVVATGYRAAKRRDAQAEARRVAVANARWEARTTINHGTAFVRLVRVARGVGVVETDDHVVEVPVGDSMGLLNAQADAELAAKAANGEDL
jgi:nitrogen fixation protein FixH